MRVFVDAVELEGGAVEVFADGLLSVGGVERFPVLGLEAARVPEVGGEGKGQGMGDVPDELVAFVADDAHGVIHLDLVEGVGGEEGVPVLGAAVAEDGEPGFALVGGDLRPGVVLGDLGVVLPEVLGLDEGLGPVLFAVEAAGEVEEAGVRSMWLTRASWFTPRFGS